MADAVASIRAVIGVQDYFDNTKDATEIKGKFALQLLLDQIEAEILKHKQLGTFSKSEEQTGIVSIFKRIIDEYDQSKKLDQLRDFKLPERKDKVETCIVGAGVSGLFIGMMLDQINAAWREENKKGKDEVLIKYSIYEASNRMGGRINTHHFSPRAHDYYDVGAMRFPEISIMDKTFRLFYNTGIKKKQGCDTYESHKDPNEYEKNGLLIPYFLKGKQCPWYYNDIKQMQPQKETEEISGQVVEKDIFQLGVKHGGDIPQEMIDLGPDNILAQLYKPFKDAMRKDFLQGFKDLMVYDGLSTRQYINQKTIKLNPKDPNSKIVALDYYTIQWLETNTAGTGWFDQAWTESVLESFTFDNPTTDSNGEAILGPDGKQIVIPWWCVDGGTSVLIEKMNDQVIVEPEFNRMVKGMALVRDENDRLDYTKTKMNVWLRGDDKVQEFDAVFNTTTLAAASHMDLSKCDLQPGQKTAIRSLRYDASTKIGIKFSRPWWIEEPFNINEGGVAPSDLFSTRMCVYPSYNIKDHENLESHQNKSAVLLASYCWGQDAQRLGSMIKQTSPDNEENLRDLLFRDLARLHQPVLPADAPDEEKAKAYDATYKVIRSAYITHYAYDWNRDVYASGAFAFFGPGQYKNMYPYLSRPTADSRLHFVGEATSCHHAWIVGALQSAQRAVHAFLYRFGWEKYIAGLEKKWGDVEGVNDLTLKWQTLLGMLPPDLQVAIHNRKTVADITQKVAP